MKTNILLLLFTALFAQFGYSQSQITASQRYVTDQNTGSRIDYQSGITPTYAEPSAVNSTSPRPNGNKQTACPSIIVKVLQTGKTLAA
jgi:hypothetical protein